MFDNRLPADQLDTVTAGDTVLIENWPRGWSEPEYATAQVTRTTATQIVVSRTSRGGRDSYEERYRKRDGGLVGDSQGRAEIVDPTHSRTSVGVTRAKRRQRAAAIDSLANQWARERDALDLLRRLHVAVGEYLDAEEGS